MGSGGKLYRCVFAHFTEYNRTMHYFTLSWKERKTIQGKPQNQSRETPKKTKPTEQKAKNTKHKKQQTPETKQKKTPKKQYCVKSLEFRQLPPRFPEIVSFFLHRVFCFFGSFGVCLFFLALLVFVFLFILALVFGFVFGLRILNLEP